MQVTFRSVIYRRHDFNPENILEEILFIIKNIPKGGAVPKKWYLPYAPSEFITILDNNVVPSLNEVLNKIDYIMSNDPPFYFCLGNHEEIDQDATLSFDNTPIKDSNRYSITLYFSVNLDDINPSQFREFIYRLASFAAWDVKYILLETGQYVLKTKNVFPDRLSVAWMLYLPKIITSSQTPSAFNLTAVECDHEQTGTIVTSVDGFFDGRDNKHISQANNIEIELVLNDLLPLHKNI